MSTSPSSFAHDLGRGQLVVGRYGREDAHDRDALDVAGDRAHEPGDRLGVERDDLASIELEAASHDRLTGRDDPAQVIGPAEQGPDRKGRGGADPDERNLPQVLPLEHGVRRVRGPEHRVGDARAVSLEPADGFGRGERDARRDVGRRRGLRPRDHPILAVEHDGIGVRAPDVDPQPEIHTLRRHGSSPPARSRGRNRTPAAPPARGRRRSARSGRRGTPRPSRAGRNADAPYGSRAPSRSRAP